MLDLVPRDIILLIFSQLSIQDILRCECVCKCFRTCSEQVVQFGSNIIETLQWNIWRIISISRGDFLSTDEQKSWRHQCLQRIRSHNRFSVIVRCRPVNMREKDLSLAKLTFALQASNSQNDQGCGSEQPSWK